jgi:S1-C subfamily serine protease
VADRVLPSVVKINVAGEVQGQVASGSGSGIILSSTGEILTNDHVVELAGSGGQISVSFEDGSRAPAEVVGTDPLTDTAVIKAEDVDGLTPATIGKSGNLDIGPAASSPRSTDRSASARTRPARARRTRRSRPTPRSTRATAADPWST